MYVYVSTGESDGLLGGGGCGGCGGLYIYIAIVIKFSYIRQ